MAMARSKATREKCYNHLSGMVYCGCCRRNMTFERRVHGTVKETHYGVFICKRKKNTTPCAYHAVPEKMLMVYAMIFGAHLMPYSWLYRSRSYLVLSVVIPLLALIVGLTYPPYILAAGMFVVEVVFVLLLAYENRRITLAKKKE